MSNVETGAKLVLTINGQEVAYASNVNYNLAYNTIPISGIDQIEIDELAEVSISVNFTCSMFRVNKKGAISLGLMPKLSQILKRDELTAVIKSRVSNSTLLIVAGLKCIGRSGNFDARGAWVEILTFQGRRLYDEAER
jgi:hypothetical protein